ncbi:hypothetical protein CEXT_32781 [Caerostris extrusa]|uniref:Uncharacterized protein n=1 Tax=Caerostris extrusa TaxID=172846 RepID=A0AAV4SJD0_CAEEX|nr:hypothetical protein CEXT_32781 [Caerostris extrusa]
MHFLPLVKIDGHISHVYGHRLQDKNLDIKDETDKGAMGFKSACWSIKQKSHRFLRLPPTRFLLASYKQLLAPRKPFGVEGLRP